MVAAKDLDIFTTVVWIYVTFLDLFILFISPGDWDIFLLFCQYISSLFSLFGLGFTLSNGHLNSQNYCILSTAATTSYINIIIIIISIMYFPNFSL